MVPLSPVPEISISLAPPEEPYVEPFSPFSSCGGPTTPVDNDSFRPSLLSPPPTVSPRFPRQHSPLRPVDATDTGKGIERERFEELLRASRERNAALGSTKRSPDLRKEIAIKAHKTKQVERRALFLSKIQAPPSPSATLLPKTPPESPAIFHYSLPSPGLQSPLAVFETLATEDPNRPPRETWVEQVEFRVPGQLLQKPPPRSSSLVPKRLPSLDQITAHLSVQTNVTVVPPRRESSRLPAFLKRTSAPPTTSPPPPTVEAAVADAGVYQPPARRQSLPHPPADAELHIHSPSPRFPPSPRTPHPKLQVTTTVVPRTSSKSPTAFTTSNLRALEFARARTAHDMLKRLRRRTLAPGECASLQVLGDSGDCEGGRQRRRHSAPPELVLHGIERAGFATPKLDLPGAF